jgi:hypothetical protein
MQIVTLEAQVGRVEGLRGALAQEEAKLEHLQAARETFVREISEHVEAGRQAVATALPKLAQWRKSFQQTVDEFSTSFIGPLGRQLAEIERDLYPKLEAAVGATFHSKQREILATNSIAEPEPMPRVDEYAYEHDKDYARSIDRQVREVQEARAMYQRDSNDLKADARQAGIAAARAMMQSIGGKSEALVPFRNLEGETAKNFAQQILAFLNDSKVIVYSPQKGIAHFVGQRWNTPPLSM